MLAVASAPATSTATAAAPHHWPESLISRLAVGELEARVALCKNSIRLFGPLIICALLNTAKRSGAERCKVRLHPTDSAAFEHPRWKLGGSFRRKKLIAEKNKLNGHFETHASDTLFQQE